MGPWGRSQTAHDLGALIDAVGGTAVKRTVMGQSYGTTLVQRWLHFFPDQATEVILDSLANPGFTFTAFSERVDAVGHEYLARCAADPLCLSKLGPDPEQLAEDAFAAALDLGACPALVQAGLDRGALAGELYGLLTLLPYRSMIPPVLHRLARCNAEDVAALTSFHSLFAPSAAPGIIEELFSPFLHHHVILGEMWDASPPSPAAHLAALQTLEFGLLDVELDTLLPSWPTYGGDPLFAAYPATSVPLLLVNGDLDAQTPLSAALEAAPHFTGPFQHFVTVPGAPHGAIGGEPWSQPSAPCSVQLATAFIVDPTAPLDESCFAQADPVAFEPDAATTQLFFGLPDPWGDGGPVPPPPLPPWLAEQKRAELRAILARSRRR